MTHQTLVHKTPTGWEALVFDVAEDGTPGQITDQSSHPTKAGAEKWAAEWAAYREKN